MMIDEEDLEENINDLDMNNNRKKRTSPDEQGLEPSDEEDLQLVKKKSKHSLGTDDHQYSVVEMYRYQKRGRYRYRYRYPIL